jgi:phage shock protein A
MLKKVAFVGLGAVLLVTLAFGSRLPSYASTMYKSVQAKVDDSVSLQFKLEDARNQLDKLGPEVNQMKYEFVRQELRVEKLEDDVVAARGNLDDQLAKIVVLKNHLEEGDSVFVSKGRSFSVSDVQKDIKRRWDLYKTQETVVKTKEQVLQAQQSGLEAARQKIAETEALRETLEVEIAQLEARQKLVEVAKTSSEINFDDSRIARLRESLDDIRSRLEVEEHVVNSASAGDFGGIPLEDEIESSDVMAEINSYLGGTPDEVAELVQ